MPATTQPDYPPPHVLSAARHVLTHSEEFAQYADHDGLIDMAWRILRTAAGQRVIQCVNRPTLGPSK